MPRKPPPKASKPAPKPRETTGLPAVPLTMDELTDGMFAIRPADVQKIVGSKPGGTGAGK